MAYIGNQDYKVIEAHIGTVAGTATAAVILAKPKVNGQLWIASDTGHLYLSDGVQWQDVGQLEGDQGEVGPRGVSITSVSKTGTAGVVDLYTVTYSDSTTSTFTVTNANTWLTGVVAPTTQGNNGDLYLDTNTNYYYKKSTGTWTLQGTLRGASFSYDGVGTLAGRAAHNNEAIGYGYLALDEAAPTVYYKTSAASGDWDNGTAVGKGEQGNSIVSTTFTSTTDVSGLAGKAGAVDTYVITYDNADTDTFIVYNGANGITQTKQSIGLGNVDNTSDANKPISTLTQAALNLKANSSNMTTALALKADKTIDNYVKQLNVTSHVYTGTDLTTTNYTGGNKVVYAYIDGNLSTEKYYDTDGTTLLLTITYGYTDGNLTSETRS